MGVAATLPELSEWASEYFASNFPFHAQNNVTTAT